jgi:hypothetical protein
MSETIDDILERDYGDINDVFVRADELRELLADSVRECLNEVGMSYDVICNKQSVIGMKCQACQRILKLTPSVRDEL